MKGSHLWRFFSGVSVFGDSAGGTSTFRFATLRHRELSETPSQLMDEGKKAEEMTMGEFREYLAQLSRSFLERGQRLVSRGNGHLGLPHVPAVFSAARRR